MVVSIGTIASAAQGVSYFERDGYYARGDPAHLDASAWAGRGAEALGLSGPVEPEVFRDVLEGTVPDGSGRRLGRREKDGAFTHRPGRDLTFSAPKSVSLVAMLGGDAAAVAAHDEAVRRTLAWLEATTVQTRMKDADTVDNVIAAMEANHPHLTSQKSFYVEISRARDRAELVTDDAARLRERLEATTGERVAALEALESKERDAPAEAAGRPERLEPEHEGKAGRRAEPELDAPAQPPVERSGEDQPARDRLPSEPAKDKAVELDFGLELEL